MRENNREDCEVEDRYEPGILYWHEALDRAHVARDHFFEYVEKHPAVMNDEELKDAAENVGIVMGKFYQLVGAKYHEFETLHPDQVKAELVEALVRISEDGHAMAGMTTGSKRIPLDALKKAGVQD